EYGLIALAVDVQDAEMTAIVCVGDTWPGPEVVGVLRVVERDVVGHRNAKRAGPRLVAATLVVDAGQVEVATDEDHATADMVVDVGQDLVALGAEAVGPVAVCRVGPQEDGARRADHLEGRRRGLER